MYPTSYHSFGIFGKELNVSLLDGNTITIAAHPAQAEDKTSIMINLAGDRSQLRCAAKRILELVPEEIDLPQPDPDDIALDEVALNIENHKIKPPQKELPQSA